MSRKMCNLDFERNSWLAQTDYKKLAFSEILAKKQWSVFMQQTGRNLLLTISLLSWELPLHWRTLIQTSCDIDWLHRISQLIGTQHYLPSKACMNVWYHIYTHFPLLICLKTFAISMNDGRSFGSSAQQSVIKVTSSFICSLGDFGGTGR